MNNLEVIAISSQVNLEKVRKCRELALKGISESKDASEAARQSHKILTELLAIANQEIAELWQKYPDANYIGIRFDRQQAIIGTEKKEVYMEAKKLYHDQPLLDYMASRKPIFLGGIGA